MFSDLVSFALLWLLLLGLLMFALKVALYFWRITATLGLLMLGMVCWQEPKVFYFSIVFVPGVLVLAKMDYYMPNKKKA